MYIRHKNRECLFIKYRRCIFGGKKAPAGALLVAPSLESRCFMYLRHKNRGSLFIEYRRSILGGGKAPAGAPLVAPSLQSTCVMSLRHKHQDSLFSRNIISYIEKIFKFAYGPKSDFWLGFRTENANTIFSRHGRKIGSAAVYITMVWSTILDGSH